MKKFLILAVAASMILALPGCSKPEEEAEPSKYGDTLFECNPENLIGFSGAYYSEDEEVVLVFNEDYVENEEYRVSIYDWFVDGIRPHERIYVDSILCQNIFN